MCHPAPGPNLVEALSYIRVLFDMAGIDDLNVPGIVRTQLPSISLPESQATMATYGGPLHFPEVFYSYIFCFPRNFYFVTTRTMLLVISRGSRKSRKSKDVLYPNLSPSLSPFKVHFDYNITWLDIRLAQFTSQ